MIYIMLVVAFFKGESVCKNPTIKFAIETEFKGVKQFSEGLAAVQIGIDSEGWEEWVYIDKKGKRISKRVFSSAEDFRDGLALVGKKDGTYEFVDKSGKTVPSSGSPTDNFSEGLAAASLLGKGGGYIDGKGKWVIPPGHIGKKISFAKPFREGFAAVTIGEGLDSYGLFLNKKGESVFEAIYQSVGSFNNGLAPVKDCGTWGYIDRNGKMKIKPQFFTAAEFCEGLAVVHPQSHNKFAVIDTTGKIIMEGEGAQFKPYSGGMLATNQGYFDKKGKLVISSYFDRRGSFFDDIASVKLNNKWGFIALDGEWLIQPFFDDATDFSEEMVGVCIGDKWGFISKSSLIEGKKTFQSQISDKPAQGDIVRAIEQNVLEKVKTLISDGVDVSKVSGCQTPLSAATIKGNIEVIKLLLEANADLEIPDCYGNTPLQRAAFDNKFDIALLFIQKGANVNTVNYNGETPLLSAAWNGNMELVRLLLDHSAKVNVSNNGGMTPLENAERNGHYEIMELLSDYSEKE